MVVLAVGIAIILAITLGPSLVLRHRMKSSADQALSRLGATIRPEIRAGRSIPDPRWTPKTGQ